MSLNSDGTPKYTEVTNGATTGDTQWLGSPDGTKPEYDIPISQASVDEFLQGHFVVQDMSGYSAPTRLYKPAVIGQKYDGTDYYDYGSIKRADGAAAKVFYYQDMDGKDLAIELDGYISDSKFVSDSGFEVSLDSLQRNLKASKADPNEPDGFIQIIEPAVSSAKSQTPSSPQERDNFKAEVSRRVSNSEGFLTSNVVDGMSKEQISGFLSYLDDNGADEKSVAKAVILYGAHMNSVTDVERKLYAEAADEVYTAGSARKNRKLKDVFASIPTAFEQTTKEKLKEVGREESAQPLEILSLIMPEIRNLPTVVSSPEKLPESTSERPHIYRGVEPNSRIRASTFHKDWAFSAHPYWGGNKGGKAAGYGNYFSTQYGTASGYAGLGYSSSPPSDRRGERGRIAYAVMKPEAKELETDSESGGKKGRLSSMKKAGYIWLSAYLASQGIAPGTQEFKDFMKKYGSSRMMFDESFFPAARGYDYSRLPSSDGRWVIYSRGMMVVVDPTPKRGSN